MTISVGFVGYWVYRQHMKREFLRSNAHYRMDQIISNITPWEANWFTWYRMPELEWTAHHRFRPYYVLGQLDVSKEILIPKKKAGNEGFEVFSPLYCYDGGSVDFTRLAQGKDAITVERSAIIVNRGWIPAALKDKSLRPETNTRMLTKVKGCWKRSKDIHDYKVPNNPDSDDWHNVCVQDMATFWELPNFNEFKFFYFQAVDIDGSGNKDPVTGETAQFPILQDRDSFIEEEYHWRVTEKHLGPVWKGMSSIATFSGLMAAAWM